MVTSLKRSQACIATVHALNSAAGHHQPMPSLETPGHPQACLEQSPVVTVPFSWVLVHKVLLCPPRVYFPVLCKFWQLCGGLNGDLLQEGSCHIQVCCTQSPCPCSSPLLTCTTTGDTQAQFYLSLCAVSGSWCPQGLFEPSEHLWWVWGLILNMIRPLS